MFERMEVAEQVCEGGAPSKTSTRAHANCDGRVSKWKGGEAALPTNPEKGRAGKRKTKSVGHLSHAPSGAKNKCLFHGPGHSS